ncbi:MAG: laccase domain-containing protein, partial [Acidobacteria bacterium]|nr:laccase domain-containing protein [Acidobacteriota bacterium]
MPSQRSLTPEVRGALSVHVIRDAARLGVDAFVTDRFGGVSEGPYDSLNLGDHVGDDIEHVRENRRRVALAAGVDELVIVRQVHGRDVLDAPEPGVACEGDGLFTSSDERALAVLVADCVPVLLVDEESRDFAVVHAGWRGLHAGILSRAVARFNHPSSIFAFLGPAISRERYQVGPDVATNFTDVPGALLDDVGDRSLLDLHLVGAHQLRQLGLNVANIVTSDQ